MTSISTHFSYGLLLAFLYWWHALSTHPHNYPNSIS